MKYPSFSIIVPTRNRRQQLRTCLQSFSLLNYPADCFEVIVVDDGSETPITDVVDEYCSRLSVTLIAQTHTGPAGARNTGAAKAQGQYLAFTDDDCMPAPGWLNSLSDSITTAPEAAIGGRTINALHDNLFSVTSQYIQDIVYTYYNKAPDQSRFFATNNLVVPSERFHACGGFNPASFPYASEDRDFCNRWLHHGNRMIFAPEALVHHAHKLSAGSFLLQHFRYGRGAFRFHRACIKRDPNHAIVKKDFYMKLLSDLIPKTGSCQPLLTTAILVLWQLSNTAGYCWEWAYQKVIACDRKEIDAA